MDSEATKLRSRKIPLYPTPNQKKIFKQWFGICRWYYNRSIDYVEETKVYNYQKVRRAMRDKYRYQDKQFPEWYKGDIPSRIIDDIIRRCIKNYKIGFNHLKLGLIKKFKMQYKAKKDIYQSIPLSHLLFGKNNSFSVKYIGKYLPSAIPFKNMINTECILLHNIHLDSYHLVVPEEWTDDKKVPFGKTIALDPGKRKFLVGYSSAYHVLTIGEGSWKRMEKIYKEIDIVSSKRTLIRNKARKNMYSRIIQRKYRKLKNLRDELHWKTINYLCANYSTITLGDLSSKKISSKDSNLDKNSKRAFSCLSFYLFKQRMQYRCDQKQVFCMTDESYTSKTCSRCGQLNDSLKGSEVFSCLHCGYETDRDFNGARNIYIKHWFN